MKFDFEDPSETIEYELPDGEFGTEPFFVGNGGTNEDDGYILVQTLNARAKKASITILDAKNMKPVYRGLAPEMGLFGLHTRFFGFDIGCSTDDCTPSATTTSTTTTTTTTASANSLSASQAFLVLLLILKSFE